MWKTRRNGNVCKSIIHDKVLLLFNNGYVLKPLTFDPIREVTLVTVGLFSQKDYLAIICSDENVYRDVYRGYWSANSVDVELFPSHLQYSCPCIIENVTHRIITLTDIEFGDGNIKYSLIKFWWLILNMQSFFLHYLRFTRYDIHLTVIHLTWWIHRLMSINHCILDEYFFIHVELFIYDWITP